MDNFNESNAATAKTASVTADFDAVPVINFAGALTTDPAAKFRGADEIKRACTEVGFFYIANHGIPQQLIDKMFAQGPRFFGLPLAEKMKLRAKFTEHFCGYVPLLDENADPLNRKGDLHEAFDFATEDAQVGEAMMWGDFRQVSNQWPSNLPGFRETLNEYAVAIRILAGRLFGIFAISLDVPENYFDKLTDRPMSLARILYYPSQDGPIDETILGVGAHTDHECFTILFQDRVPALQVKNGRGDWIDAPPIPGTFVVNIGDQMARWTNGIFASTVHRVVNRSGRARYSVPFFMGANADVVIEPLASCVSPTNPAKFPPIIAGEYVSASIYNQYHSHEKK